MKYALLLYTSPEARERQMQDYDSVAAEYNAVTALPGVSSPIRLQPTDSATTVRVDDGETLLSDGPFVAAKEFLGGLYVVEADNLDAAIAIAARLPVARMGGAVEVRPVMEV
jgi:hypothetical protein